jgi:glycosyl transferase, family 25
MKRQPCRNTLRRAFIINLVFATERWAFVEQSFNCSQLTLVRVPAVDGKKLVLPHKDYSEQLYRWFHGRESNPRELACYLSHLRALHAFLSTDESHALIAEDDILLQPDFDNAIKDALSHSRHWNILRLTGLNAGHPLPTGKKCSRYSLCVNFGRIKGSGAYLIDRHAAAVLSRKLLPMRLPYDHALDREWWFGLRSASLSPFPVSQNNSPFLSSVQPGIYAKLAPRVRFLATYPYQALNEVSRWIYRGCNYLRLRCSKSS